MARVRYLKAIDRTQTERSTYSVGSSSQVTLVNTLFRGDASRVSSFHLASVSFASLCSSCNSSSLFSSHASNHARISSFSSLVIWSIHLASSTHSLQWGAHVFSSRSVKRSSYFTILTGKYSHP